MVPLCSSVVVGAFKSRLTCLHLSLGANVSFHVHTGVFIWKSISFTVFLPAVPVRNGNVAESAVPQSSVLGCWRFSNNPVMPPVLCFAPSVIV